MHENEHRMHLAAGQAYGRVATCGPANKPKVNHCTEDIAARVAAKLNARPSRDHDVEPYPCHWCGGWHVGRVMEAAERERFFTTRVISTA
jgi:hypothetical protein